MSPSAETIVEIPLALIERGFFQPREYFSQEAMEATKRSIREKGQKYPVIVRPILPKNPLFDAAWPETHYELADGERRFRCCKELGFKTLKALVRSLNDEEMLDYTLTTNDSLPLNPIEKATVFSRLAKEFGKSQADIAKSFHLKQQQVSEYMRLLDLPKPLQDLTARAVISVRHARELLKIEDKEKMESLALEVEKNALSTRELTKIIKYSRKNEGNIKDLLDLKKKEPLKSEVSPASDASFQRNVSINKGLYGFAWLEHLYVRILPRKFYGKLSEWLTYSLGTPLKPEFWLVRVKVSFTVGILIAILALWVPKMALAALLGAAGILLSYLFLV